MRGRGLLCREAPSLALPPQETGVGRRWGRGRFSKRSASPPDPLSRRVAGNRLGLFFGSCAPMRVGASPIDMVEVTAADRAAAPYAAWGTNPSARLRRAPPLSGEALRGGVPQRLSPRKHARSGGEAATGYCFVPVGNDQRALRSPFGNLRPITSSNYMVSNVGRSRRLCQPP